MVTETKSPKRLISYIRMKMTQIIDVNKPNKRRMKVPLIPTIIQCLSKHRHLKECKMRSVEVAKEKLTEAELEGILLLLQPLQCLLLFSGAQIAAGPSAQGKGKR